MGIRILYCWYFLQLLDQVDHPEVFFMRYVMQQYRINQFYLPCWVNTD